MGLRSWAKKKAKQAKKKAEEAKRQAEKAAREAKEKAEREAREAKEWAERKAREKAKEAKNMANQVGDILMNPIDEAKNLKKDLERLVKEADRLEDRITSKAESVVTEKIPDLVVDALEEVAKLAQSEVYKKAAATARTVHKELGNLRKSKPNLVGYIDEMSFTLHVGPTKLTYSRFYERAEDISLVLDRMANEPPQIRRSTLIASMKATAPDSTDLGISVNFALVAGSDALGGGFELPAIPLPLLTEIADWVLREIGVPE